MTRFAGKFLSFIGVILLTCTASLTVDTANSQTDNTDVLNSREVIENQISAFQRKAHDEAFNYASPTIRSVIDNVDRFIAMVRKGYEPIYSARSWKFGRAKVDSQKVHHEVLVIGPEGRNWVALYTMEKQESGNWKVSSVLLKKSGGKSI